MTWPVATPIDRVTTDVGRTRRQHTPGVGGALVTTIDTYAAGFADGQAASSGAPTPKVAQLFPRGR